MTSSEPLLTPKEETPTSKPKLEKKETVYEEVLPEEPVVKRKPFSRLRCLWDPFTAEDPALCEPFARLTIKVGRATGLTGPDLLGLADPYVTLNLDSDETNIRTSTQRRTLDPVWNEKFTIDVYHPISILTITLMDEEYGAGDIADLLGLGDVMAGWVDIRLGALPMNEWVSGWFDFGHPEHFRDTIKGRLEDPNIESHGGGVGKIHLKLHMETHFPRSEIFAMCLPLPDLGHACHLDLADLMHDILALSKFSDKMNKDVWADIERALHYATFVYLSALGLIWWPPSIVPALSVGGPLGLIYMSTKFTVPSTRAGKVKADVLKVVESSDKAEADAAVVDETQAEVNPLDDLEPALKSVVRILPRHVVKEIRKAAADVEWTIGGVEAIEKLSELRVGFGFSTPFLIMIAIVATVPVAIAALLFRQYQVTVLQIGATIFVTYWLFNYSMPGRFFNGMLYFCGAHWRIKSRSLHLAHEVDEEDHNSVRGLEIFHIKHLRLHAKGKLNEEEHLKSGNEKGRPEDGEESMYNPRSCQICTVS